MKNSKTRNAKTVSVGHIAGEVHDMFHRAGMNVDVYIELRGGRKPLRVRFSGDALGCNLPKEGRMDERTLINMVRGAVRKWTNATMATTGAGRVPVAASL